MRRGRVFFETMPCGAFFVQIFMQKCESRLGERGVERDSGRGQWSVIRGQWFVVSGQRAEGLAGIGAARIFNSDKRFCSLPFPLVLKNESRARMTHFLFRQKFRPLTTDHCPVFPLKKPRFDTGKRGFSLNETGDLVYNKNRHIIYRRKRKKEG